MRFDTCAHSHDTHAMAQRAFAARIAQFAGVKPGETILEFGAGTGALTLHLCDAGAHVRATDISAAMVSLGRAAVPSAVWSELDAFREPLPECPFQVSSGLLQWAEEPVSILQQWKASLTPGGKMVHAFACEPCLMEWRRLVGESPVRWRDERAWCEVFSTAGCSSRRSSNSHQARRSLIHAI